MQIELPRSRLKRVFIAGMLALTSGPVVAFPAATGGSTSVNKQDANAFSLPSANMSFENRIDFNVGNSFFRNPWVIAPASTGARDGLGPLFNTNGCQNCHIKDGRGHLPQPGEDNMVSMLVRISIPPATKEDWKRVHELGVIADPVYGDQIQDFAIPGVKPEASIKLSFTTKTITLADGEKVELSKPIVSLADFAYGDPHPQLSTSLRLAPPMIGLGLLEAIPESELRKLEDESDKNGDQISGRLNRVWDSARKGYTVGRFGWKAEQPSLRQQNAAAFSGDIGITSSLIPDESCTPAQKECNEQPSGGSPEITDKLLDLVTFYSRNLAVPLRRDIEDPEVKKGEQLFRSIGCMDCHKAPFTTADLVDHKEQGKQVIYPFTDLLLHDMGEDLSDNRPVFAASGREWRTPPLWGLGLTRVVGDAEHYLHDGRARSLLEAVLWHGGEAESSQQKVVNMTTEQRNALIRFLESL
ncbi:di-heme oxidoreductase family protein [Ketobacter sp.]|nr:MAG: thiol oxidoreductase [Ketobacter sp.]